MSTAAVLIVKNLANKLKVKGREKERNKIITEIYSKKITKQGNQHTDCPYWSTELHSGSSDCVCVCVHAHVCGVHAHVCVCVPLHMGGSRFSHLNISEIGIHPTVDNFYFIYVLLHNKSLQNSISLKSNNFIVFQFHGLTELLQGVLQMVLPGVSHELQADRSWDWTFPKASLGFLDSWSLPPLHVAQGSSLCLLQQGSWTCYRATQCSQETKQKLKHY